MFSDLIWKISLPCILIGGFFINFNMFMVAWEVWQLIIHRIIIILHEFYVTVPFFCGSEKASLFRSEPYVPYTIQIMAVQFNSLCTNVPRLY